METSADFMFIETIRDCYISQLATESTCARGTNAPSLLDLLLTNKDLSLIKWRQRLLSAKVTEYVAVNLDVQQSQLPEHKERTKPKLGRKIPQN